MDLLAQLNPKQAEAVRHTEGPLLVLAGAGSGKTRVLTYRVAYLLRERGVSPYNILAITFTNKAAGEMRARVESLVPEFARQALWVCTFHSACLRILRREIQYMDRDKNFVIYDAGDQETLLKECLRELNYSDERYRPRSVSATISGAKNRLLDAATYRKRAESRYEQVVADVYELYQKKMLQNNALDFDDLLFYAVRLFQEFPGVLARYQDRFRYILIDEYQDTNYCQYVLVNVLAEKHRNLCVVGDPDQGIYGWRGADINNILSFERDYPEAKVVVLDQNYRSTGIILEAANQVIKNNKGRKEKRLWTSRGQGVPIVEYTGVDEHDEARFVTDSIRRMVRKEGLSYGDFSVLYRTHAQSRVLEESLIYAGIPYTIIGGFKFYDRMEIKDILAYLRVIVNPEDNLSMMRIINVPRRGIGKATVAKLAGFAAEKGLSIAGAMKRAGEIPSIGKAAAGKVGKFAVLLRQLREMEKSTSITALVREVLSKTGYLQELEAEDSVESRTRMENIKEFLSVTGEFDKNAGTGAFEGGLEEFLASISLITDVDNLEEEADQVRLMTLHSAKGLEFPVVFLVGMEEGIFPHLRSLSENRELEEERRLCYVGMTRAEERLFLIHCISRTLYGATQYNRPSRFLDEIPAKYLKKEISPLAAYKLGEPRREKESPKYLSAVETMSGMQAGKSIGRNRSWQERAHDDYRLGDKVRHRKWGVGIVVGMSGEGAGRQIRVAFPEEGVKTLLAEIAPLEKE